MGDRTITIIIIIILGCKIIKMVNSMDEDIREITLGKVIITPRM